MKNWSIKNRIIAGFGVILMITFTIGCFTYLRLVGIAQNSTELIERSLPVTLALNQIANGVTTNNSQVLKHILTTEPERIAEIDELSKRNSATITQHYKVVEAAALTEGERALYEKVLAARKAYVNRREAVYVHSRAQETQEAFALFRAEMEPAYAVYSANLKEMVDFYEKQGRAAGQKIADSVQTSIRFTIIGVSSALGLALLTGFVIVRGVNRRLLNASEALETGASQVAGAAAQVSASSQSLANGSSEQAASLEESSSSLEEMSSMTKRNAENCRQARELSGRTRVSTEAGAVRVGEMHAAMTDILDKARRMDDVIAEITEASTEQSQGIEQVNTAIGRMDKVTQANAGTAKETAAAAEELNAQSMTLRESVADLRRLIGGAGRPAAA